MREKKYNIKIYSLKDIKQQKYIFLYDYCYSYNNNCLCKDGFKGKSKSKEKIDMQYLINNKNYIFQSFISLRGNVNEVNEGEFKIRSYGAPLRKTERD